MLSLGALFCVLLFFSSADALVYPIGIISLQDGLTGRIEIVSNLSVSQLGTLQGAFTADPDPVQVNIEDCRYIDLEERGFRLYSCDFPMTNSEMNLYSGSDSTVALTLLGSATHFTVNFGTVKHLVNTSYNAVGILGGTGCIESDFTRYPKEKLSQAEISHIGLWQTYDTTLSCSSKNALSASPPWVFGTVLGVVAVCFLFYIFMSYNLYPRKVTKQN